MAVSLFFFQAEDGIRDPLVTGVQTCALPISGGRGCRLPQLVRARPVDAPGGSCDVGSLPRERAGQLYHRPRAEIGRASCRERGEISMVAGAIKRESRRETEGKRLPAARSQVR